jgi:hypothetical protein
MSVDDFVYDWRWRAPPRVECERVRITPSTDISAIKQNVEFAGRIFQNSKTKRFVFTHPNRGAGDDFPNAPGFMKG